MRVILELSHTKKLENLAEAVLMGEEKEFDPSLAPKLETVSIDSGFPAVPLPHVEEGDFPESELYDTRAGFTFDAALPESTFIVRGEIEEDALEEFQQEAEKSKNVVGVFADVGIAPSIVCPGSAPVGSDSDVERLLCTSRLHRAGMDGSGVLIAVVDTGVNMAYLNSRGKNPTFDSAQSWAWDPSAVTPGSAPVGHGTMCAFDACIAAPNCTLLDIALLHSISAPPGGTLMEGLLSDAIRAYRHLLNIMTAPRRPGELRSLVVNNSWGMFHPSWDWPVGNPGNYSDNPNHPFNRIVASLERAGADILFAAGNCGADCPDGRCQGVTTKAIYGANSSPAVTCVAGVDTTKQRVGYSAIGPGRLEREKPDLSGYTHFKGSGVYSADGGTSAACPVVTGVVAAVRSKRPHDPGSSMTSPAAIRNLIESTAEDLGASGYDFRYGHGVINGCRLAKKLAPIPDICRRYPWICDPRWWRLCRRYPWLCRPLPLPPRPGPIPPLPPGPGPSPPSPGPRLDLDFEYMEEEEDLGALLEETVPEGAEGELSPEQIAYMMGFLLGTEGGDRSCRERRKEGEGSNS